MDWGTNADWVRNRSRAETRHHNWVAVRRHRGTVLSLRPLPWMRTEGLLSSMTSLTVMPIGFGDPRSGVVEHGEHHSVTLTKPSGRVRGVKGPRKNNSLFSVGSDFVVPLGERVIFFDGKRLHFCVGDPDTLLIVSFDQPGTNTQTRTRSRRASVLEDGLETIQWAACPVFAEFAE